MKKWTVFVFVILCVFALVGCSSGSTPVIEDENAAGEWGIQVSAENISPTGLNYVITQSGGDPTASFRYGSHYWLEQYRDEEWVEVAYAPQEYEVGWTTEAHLINRDSTTTIHIDWEWLYGELPAGQYRIGKVIDNHRGPSEQEHETYYVEFVIEES